MIGLKLYTEGVLVVGMSEIEGIEEKEKPYINSGIEEGDTIVSINSKKISSTEELIEAVNSSKGEEMDVRYLQDGELKETNIKPSKTRKRRI